MAQAFEGEPAGGRRLQRVAMVAALGVAVAALLGVLGRGAAPPPQPDDPGQLEIVAALPTLPEPTATAPAAVDPGTGAVLDGDRALQPWSPLQLGTDWYCPSTAPVAAYPQGVYYLPGHPSVPERTVEPASCWHSAAAAGAQGLRPARLPRGAQQVGEIFLVRTDAEFGDACAAAAAVLGYAVPCPRLLPHVPHRSACPDSPPVLVSCVLYIEEQPVGFLLGISRLVADAQVRGLVIAAAPIGGEPALIGCDDSALGGRAGVQQCAPTPSGQSGAFPHEGRVLERSEVDGIAYAVSLDPALPDVRRLVADSIQLVGPG